MKAIKIAIVMILGLNLIYSLYGWMSTDRVQTATYPQAEVADVVQEPEMDAADGLSLAGLTALTKEVRSGQELERRLNETGSINNMDLNGDQKVDYLFVREYGDPETKIGYSITAEPVKGEVQEVADVTVEKNGDKAEIQVVGNEQIYGPQAIYNDSAPIEREVAAAQSEGENQMHRSYFYPHPLWISPWFFGFYPSFYRPYPVISRPIYSQRVQSRYNTGSVSRGRNSYQSNSSKAVTNPNRGKTASKGIARSLKNPTSTQKQFRANRSKNLGSGGFGKSSRPAAGTSTSARRAGSSFGSSSKSTSSGFGSSQKSSSRSLFGKSSRSFGSSSGSFRSSAFGSRSFSFGK